LGFNTLYLLPNVFKLLRIERPTFYTEIWWYLLRISVHTLWPLLIIFIKVNLPRHVTFELLAVRFLSALIKVYFGSHFVSHCLPVSLNVLTFRWFFCIQYCFFSK
jgi:hypothetical protein